MSNGIGLGLIAFSQLRAQQGGGILRLRPIGVRFSLIVGGACQSESQSHAQPPQEFDLVPTPEHASKMN
jgi:hypothetical protein